MKLIFTITFLFFFNIGFSCTCKSLGNIDEKQFNQYDLIATGKILSVDFEKHNQKIEVAIHNVFKGRISKMTIVLFSHSESSMCGIFPNVGEKWLIYADGKNAEFSTDLCTRTKNMTKANERNKKIIDDDLVFLKKYRTRK